MNSDDFYIDGCGKKRIYPTKFCFGPTGPTGPSGNADKITVGNTITAEADENAMVIDTYNNGTHTLDFIIPRGKDNSGISVFGSFDTKDELENAHPLGNPGESYLVDGNLYVWNSDNNNWKDAGAIVGPKGDKGDKGDPGPIGPTPTLKASYVVTFNDGTQQDGIMVTSGSNLPLGRVELDTNNLITLDNNTIKFNSAGYYKIFFTVSAYPTIHGVDFDPTKDIVSIGFKEIGTNNVYVGVGQWVFNGEAIELVAEGILSVDNTNNTYCLSNLSKETIYLNTPVLNNIASISYFSNPLITMVIEYLGNA